MKILASFIAIAQSLSICVAHAQVVNDDLMAFEPLDDDLSRLSLEDLMNVQVTSLAGIEQEWFQTPAAMYVISNEQIRRSGHRSIAEALRLAPGVFVGQVNSQAYSIGMRGFNGGLANKTLVLIDGRSVYDPLFSGTFWNVQDVLLEDIDRIEVIRGPGPTLWGANAVNGVVNVITRRADQTQGWYLGAGAGTFERAFGEARYGGKLNENSYFRVYGKWFERDHLVDPQGNSAHDDWDMWRGGLRFDQLGDDNLIFTVQADAYHSDRIGEFVRAIPVPDLHNVFESDIRDVRHAGADALFRLSRWTGANGWSLQGYYDRTERLTNVSFEVDRDTFDLDWRHGFELGDRHDILWGSGARHTRDQTSPGVNLLFDPRDRSLDTFSFFVQDTITLVPDRWFAMIGSKFDHNDYTGFEVQPSARLWWTPNDRHTTWGAVSRAMRVPSRTEVEGTIIFSFVDVGLATGGGPAGVFVPLGVEGNDDLDSEELFAYEIGHRVRMNDDITIDAALFYNDYDRLIFVPPSVIGAWNNDGYGETYGGELALSWRLEENWRLEAAYSYVDVEIHGPIFTQDETNTPHHQAQIRSTIDLVDDFEFNSSLYYVDVVPTVDAPSYVRLDLGLTWHVNSNVELSIWGLNLLDPQHPEFSGLNEVERGVYVMGSLRF
jgi:iron complex outermembrane recepter protein